MNSVFSIPKPVNEPPKSYLPGSPERQLLKDELEHQRNDCPVIPLIIGGKEVYTERRIPVCMPGIRYVLFFFRIEE